MEKLLEKRAALLAAKAKVEQKLKRAASSHHKRHAKQSEKSIFPTLEAIAETCSLLPQNSPLLSDLLDIFVDSSGRLWLLHSAAVLKLEAGSLQQVLEGNFELVHSSEKTALIKCSLSGKHYAIGRRIVQSIELPKDCVIIAATVDSLDSLRLVLKSESSFSVLDASVKESEAKVARYDCDHVKVVLGNVLWTRGDETFMLLLNDMRTLRLGQCLNISAAVYSCVDESTGIVWTLSADSESWLLHRTDKSDSAASVQQPHGLTSIEGCGMVVCAADVFWAFSAADSKLTIYDLATLESRRSFPLPRDVSAVSRVIAADSASYLVVATENSCKIAIKIA